MRRNSQRMQSKILVLQQQYNHQKKLYDIYSKRPNPKIIQTSRAITNVNRKTQNKNNFQHEQHVRTIKKLIKTLTSQKSLQERNKDPHDFIAYPVYFFRPEQSIKKQKKKKNLNKTISQIEKPINYYSEQDSQYINRYFPAFSQYDQQQLHDFAKGLNKLLIAENINDLKSLNRIEDKILSVLPRNCPLRFRKAVQEMLVKIKIKLCQ